MDSTRREIAIQLQTLTPLWTGGVEGKVDRVHETGILGSLRWWFEVLVRGVGGVVKDPTSDTAEERPSFDSDKFQKSKAEDARQRLLDAGLCDVSCIFGATGWRRRFQVRVLEQHSVDARWPERIRAEGWKWKDSEGNERVPTWFFPHPPFSGSFRLGVKSLSPELNPEVIAGVVQLLADYSAIGARPQMGFGVVQIDGDRLDTRPLYDWLVGVAGDATYSRLPSLRNIFLAQARVGNERPAATFDIKARLRRAFTDREVRHLVMGVIQRGGGGGRIAAKIKMSAPYSGGLVRVWGWVPEESEGYRSGWSRGNVVGIIHSELRECSDIELWREFDSPRDTVTPGNRDVKSFVRSLLGI